MAWGMVNCLGRHRTANFTHRYCVGLLVNGNTRQLMRVEAISGVRTCIRWPQEQEGASIKRQQTVSTVLFVWPKTLRASNVVTSEQ